MQLVPDPEAASWLEQLSGGPEDFEWDRGNRAKNRKHDVAPEDVEAMFRAALFFGGRIVEPKHEEPRWLVLGRSEHGRRLTLIFTRRGARVRPISCRPMRRNERKLYEEAINQEPHGPIS